MKIFRNRYSINLGPFPYLVLTISAVSATILFVPANFWVQLLYAIKAEIFWILLLVLFCILALSLVWKSWGVMDIWLFDLFNNRGGRPFWLDFIMLAFTQIGNGLFAYLIAYIFFIHSQKIFSYELAVGNIALWFIVAIMKTFFHRKRPFSSLKQIRIVGAKEKGSSFPSGHTSQAFFMASLFSHYFPVNQQIRLSLYLVAFLVGFTRMYLGMHFPRDIFGGAILGTSWGMACIILSKYIEARLIL